MYGNIVWGGAGRGQNRFYGAHGVAMAPCPVARVCNINIYIKILQSSYCARVVRAPRTPYPASRPIIAGLIVLHAYIIIIKRTKLPYVVPRARACHEKWGENRARIGRESDGGAWRGQRQK